MKCSEAFDTVVDLSATELQVPRTSSATTSDRCWVSYVGDGDNSHVDWRSERI